jgi:hypothetical protein
LLSAATIGLAIKTSLARDRIESEGPGDLSA